MFFPSGLFLKILLD